MNRSSSRPFPASLSYYIVPSSSFPSLSCRACRGSLDVHQPDPNRPEQFLGTCTKCGAWFRVAFSTSETELVVIEIPDCAQIPDASTPSGDGQA